MGPGSAFESAYAYATNSPLVFTDPSGNRSQGPPTGTTTSVPGSSWDEPLAPVVAFAGPYNRAAAVAWARANGPSTVDKSYDAYPNDCAHFISTTLVNGGVHETEEWNHKGDHRGRVKFWNHVYGTKPWRIVADQYSYFTGGSGMGHEVALPTGTAQEAGPAEIGAGDIVYFDWSNVGGPTNHGAVVLGRDGAGQLLLAHHNHGSVGKADDPFSALVSRAIGQKRDVGGKVPAHYVKVDR